jgi:hypothetical protein
MFSLKNMMTGNWREEARVSAAKKGRRAKTTNLERNDEEDAEVAVLVVPQSLNHEVAGEEGAEDDVERDGETGVNRVVEGENTLVDSRAKVGLRIAVGLLLLDREDLLHRLRQRSHGRRNRMRRQGRSLRDRGSVSRGGAGAGESAGTSVRRATESSVED